jgi:hypothetical protein
MALRSSRETIEDLRLLLSKFEQCPDVGDSPASLPELTRILRTRIAELEAELEADFALIARISPKLTQPIPR